MGLAGKVPAHLKPNAWLEVTGHYTGRQRPDYFNDRPIPFIEIVEVRPVPAPRQPYEG